MAKKKVKTQKNLTFFHFVLQALSPCFSRTNGIFESTLSALATMTAHSLCWRQQLRLPVIGNRNEPKIFFPSKISPENGDASRKEKANKTMHIRHVAVAKEVRLFYLLYNNIINTKLRAPVSTNQKLIRSVNKLQCYVADVQL